MKYVCAWCQEAPVKAAGKNDGQISYGICGECYEKHFPELYEVRFEKTGKKEGVRPKE